MLTDILVIAVILLLVGAAAGYIIRQKKKGTVCIGCPAGENACKRAGCGGNCSGCGGSCGTRH